MSMQRMYRGRKARGRVRALQHEQREREAAVVNMQRLHRGAAARRRVMAKRREAKHRTQRTWEERDAAVRMQSQVRGWRERRTMRQKKASAVRIQALARGRSVRRMKARGAHHHATAVRRGAAGVARDVRDVRDVADAGDGGSVARGDVHGQTRHDGGRREEEAARNSASLPRSQSPSSSPFPSSAASSSVSSSSSSDYSGDEFFADEEVAQVTTHRSLLPSAAVERDDSRRPVPHEHGRGRGRESGVPPTGRAVIKHFRDPRRAPTPENSADTTTTTTAAATTVGVGVGVGVATTARATGSSSPTSNPQSIARPVSRSGMHGHGGATVHRPTDRARRARRPVSANRHGRRAVGAGVGMQSGARMDIRRPYAPGSAGAPSTSVAPPAPTVATFQELDREAGVVQDDDDSYSEDGFDDDGPPHVHTPHVHARAGAGATALSDADTVASEEESVGSYQSDDDFF